MYNLLIAECMKVKKNVALKMLVIGICGISVSLAINNIYGIKVCYAELSQIESYSGASQFCDAIAMGHNFENISILLSVFGEYIYVMILKESYVKVLFMQDVRNLIYFLAR
ncbi:hypothetical protein [Clostridium saccharobutylicum]|uniref:hypothetical protein n=1 Tax=Clostridium saccharobutylicum TaxID=169679 RepID=UPI00179B6B61|nr:hypothetical protein [Clostridium saccharobutylicum]